MSRSALMPWLWVGMISIIAGCADNAMVLKGKVGKLEQEQVALQRQYQQLQDRATALDRDNQESASLLAQSRQESKVAEDQLAALREQLRSTTAQLAQAHSEKENTDKRVQALTASMQRQGGVTISPNSNLAQTLPAISIPGVAVRRDGDVIRIELAATSLFDQNSAQLRPGAANLIADVASEIARTYPEQIIGVEGHTNTDPVTGPQWRSNQELSIAQAMSVYDILANRSRLRANQLFVVGHGGNHPIVSNATYEGKQRNRRVELVVYPDRRN
jgi:flagellar motor protein MotB